MKKTLLLASAILFAASNLNAQTTIFEDSFETYTNFAISGVGSWTLTDVDLQDTYGFSAIDFENSGEPKSFQVFNSTATTPAMTSSASSNWTAKTGAKMMVCFASDSSPWNNDWMISPQMQLLQTGNTLTFWAKSCDSTYGNEKFTVYVSTTNTNVSSFTAISATPVSSPADAQWHQYTYNLNAYAGQNIYIAIRCTSQDQFGFAIDDFKVVGNSVLSTNDISSREKSISVYPNPTTDYLTINSEEKIDKAEVFDASGRKINVNFTDNKADVRNLQKGAYIINIETKAGKTSSKFIKK
ncbi:choice-of-anchor J domain-containing protein [Chryseobacterium sp. C39-AII1]|uniref:T9SS-dependent choice-of-anchor J family protein n=1 Tax=Chryseobacterium sp. C39-AII1 TaxID=3080332 RepID=UPI003209B8CA